MNTIKKNILILDGNSSQCLPLIYAFKSAGHFITVVSPYKTSPGYFSRYASKKLIWPNAYTNDKETHKKIADYIENNPTDLILGIGEQTAKLLSVNRDFYNTFTKTIISDYSTFTTASDKFKCMEFCAKNDIPSPKTIDGNELSLKSIEKIPFPVIVKPKHGVGSVGLFRFNNKEELFRKYEKIKEAYGDILIQEYIPNEEQYTIEAFCDKNSKVKACVVALKARFYPCNGGTSSCNITVKNNEVTKIVSSFLEKIKWTGNANLDVIFDPRDKTPKLIEINPRIGATTKIAFASGVNIAKMQLELAFAENVEEQLEYKEGVILRNLMLETLWFFSSSYKELKKTSPSFFNFFGKSVYYQEFSIRDPFTFIGFYLGILKKYINPKLFRKKFSKVQ